MYFVYNMLVMQYIKYMYIIIHCIMHYITYTLYAHIL